jgi:hypothetical protein
LSGSDPKLVIKILDPELVMKISVPTKRSGSETLTLTILHVPYCKQGLTYLGKVT